jgi:galactose mutarotase-like enzyme
MIACNKVLHANFYNIYCMNLEINNPYICAKFKLKGAELCNLVNKRNQEEYIWQAGKEWPKHSPILFPIVGTLPNNTYTFQGKKYSLNRHGFARDMDFEVIRHTTDQISFSLQYNENTLSIYPFKFQLIINYQLIENTLIVKYEVKNLHNTEKEIYFSIGAHPAFKIPLNALLSYEDYYIKMEILDEDIKFPIPIYPLDESGKITSIQIPYIFNNNVKISLKYELFKHDALIFKKFKNAKISIGTNHDKKSIELAYRNFPYLGIWSAKNADFVCLEPWNGITSNNEFNGDITQKEGIIKLDSNHIWTSEFSISVI